MEYPTDDPTTWPNWVGCTAFTLDNEIMNNSALKVFKGSELPRSLLGRMCCVYTCLPTFHCRICDCAALLVRSTSLFVLKGSAKSYFTSKSGRWIACFTKSGPELLMHKIHGESKEASYGDFTFSAHVWAFWR